MCITLFHFSPNEGELCEYDSNLYQIEMKYFSFIHFDNHSISAPMRVSSSTTISDEELVTYNVKELNRVLKSKGTFGGDCHIDVK